MTATKKPSQMDSAIGMLVDGFLTHEALLHKVGSIIMILVGMCVIFVEVGLGARAPYGRFATLSDARWYGPPVHPKAAWVFQESLALLVPVVVLLSGRSLVQQQECLASTENRILLAMFMGHYAYRALVFPFRMRGGKPMPIGICLLAAAFCLFNGYIQGRAWTAFESFPTSAGAGRRALFAGGVLIWGVGLYINLHSDHVLRTLRTPGETGYKIPYGGAFEYVSGANYFGEIVEWIGYAIASGGRLPAVAFAFFTFANTAPRAHHHHKWYLAKFDNYPKERRAVIPFLW